MASMSFFAGTLPGTGAGFSAAGAAGFFAGGCWRRSSRPSSSRGRLAPTTAAAGAALRALALLRTLSVAGLLGAVGAPNARSRSRTRGGSRLGLSLAEGRCGGCESTLLGFVALRCSLRWSVWSTDLSSLLGFGLALLVCFGVCAGLLSLVLLTSGLLEWLVPREVSDGCCLEASLLATPFAASAFSAPLALSFSAVGRAPCDFRLGVLIETGLTTLGFELGTAALDFFSPPVTDGVAGLLPVDAGLSVSFLIEATFPEASLDLSPMAATSLLPLLLAEAMDCGAAGFCAAAGNSLGALLAAEETSPCLLCCCALAVSRAVPPFWADTGSFPGASMDACWLAPTGFLCWAVKASGDLMLGAAVRALSSCGALWAAAAACGGVLAPGTAAAEAVLGLRVEEVLALSRLTAGAFGAAAPQNKSAHQC